MKRLAFALTILFTFTYISAQTKSGISFYTFNEAFRGMTLQITTPDGHTYEKKWKLIDYDWFLKRVNYENISFPTDGRNCKVKVRFVNMNNDTCEANFLLNDYSYLEHDLYLFISSYTLMPGLSSNFGPIREQIRLVSSWYYPQDDFIIHPKVKKETKLAPLKYYQELKMQILGKRAAVLIK